MLRSHRCRHQLGEVQYQREAHERNMAAGLNRTEITRLGEGWGKTGEISRDAPHYLRNCRNGGFGQRQWSNSDGGG